MLTFHLEDYWQPSRTLCHHTAIKSLKMFFEFLIYNELTSDCPVRYYNGLTGGRTLCSHPTVG